MENLVTPCFQRFYASKTVLITGHTGFKGSWLALWLHHLGARVFGYGHGAPTSPSLFELIQGHAIENEYPGDVRDGVRMQEVFGTVRPDVIFHLAAQPLVRRSYLDPLPTFTINALGTAQVLEAVRVARVPAHVVVITTDKCYENVGKPEGYQESDALGGHDIYSASKAAAELAVQAWRRSFFQDNPALGNVASARGGNVIGGGDYAEDRLVPDCVRALLAGETIAVRNPHSTRPWQHVLDCLSGYLWLGARLGLDGKNAKVASAFNFGPDPTANRPVVDLVEGILQVWPGAWKSLAPPNAPHEASKLNLNIEKAARVLGWRPTWDFETTVRETMTWYQRRHLNAAEEMVRFSVDQIERFTRAAAASGATWAGKGGG
ncbi:MAG: CDP-glucose 4,6-dehydratase [Verrucomicrobiales bacterium]|nr:CDP-glucose 4,6-dehydratase [Verrucomicrobiales bacterium]